jgi:hypothetical protein
VVTPDLDIRLYSAAGVRLALPREMVTAIEWETLERGGWANGTLSLGCSWSECPVSGGERVDVRLFGTLLYRGWVWIPERDVQPEGARVDLRGMVEFLNGYLCRRNYAYAAATDVGTVFAAIVSDWVAIGGRFPSVVVDAGAIGVTTQVLEARDQNMTDTFNSLCDLGMGVAYWGADADGSGADRLYIRARPTAVGKVYSVGGSCVAMSYPPDRSRIVNRVVLTGGRVAQPNLLTNGSFEQPGRPDEGVGNLVANPSFESAGPIGWVFTGDSALAAGAGHSGNAYMRLGFAIPIPSATGSVSEDSPTYRHRIDPSRPYRLTIWAQRAVAGTPSKCAPYAVVQNGAGATLATILGTQTDPGATWTRQVLDLNLGAYPTAAYVYVGALDDPTNASGGVSVDDITFAEYPTVQQAGWLMQPAGAAQIDSLDWAAAAVAASHGGYCVKVQPKGVVSAGSDWVELRTPQANRIAVSAGQTYTLLLRYRTAGAASVVSWGVSTFLDDGSAGSGGYQAPDVTTSATTWMLGELVFTAAASDVEAEVYLRVKSNTVVYWDSVMVVAGAAPVDALSNKEYWEADLFEDTIDTSDAAFAGEAYAGSIASYGEREQAQSVRDVVDRASSLVWADGFFSQNALPVTPVQITVPVDVAGDLLDMSGLVRIVNLPTAIAAAFPVRIRYQVSGSAASLDADLGVERMTIATVARWLAETRKIR